MQNMQFITYSGVFIVYIVAACQESIFFPSAMASSKNGKPLRSDSDARGQGAKSPALSRAEWYFVLKLISLKLSWSLVLE